jgi:hypothetical protein
MHPLLSPLGIGVTILIFLGMGVSFMMNGSAMFSPGDLTDQNPRGQSLGGFASHAEFETECQHCHDPFLTNQADLCVRCHTKIMKQVADQTGTHAKIKNLPECRNCHPDHQGRDFDPTAAAFRLFDHEMMDFSLTWHQVDYDLKPMICDDCHSREAGFDLKANTCQDCHAGHDPDFMAKHLQDFGDDCLACHDGSGNIANFDHAVTRFPLEGKHTQVLCVDCHLDGQFKELPLKCNACHKEPDVHAGLFSMNCESCHTADDWSALVRLDGGLFDHFEQTQFSLNLHLTNYADQLLLCADCHTSSDGFEISFNMQFCVDCHTTEQAEFMSEHKDQFGQDCLTCHDGVDRMHDFDHARFFMLDGAHAETACVGCHVDRVFNGTPAECAACHREPEIHAGVFGLQCENCHSSTAWSPAQMVEHIFPLDHGEEGMVACETCHVERYTSYTCYGCHEHQPGEILSEHLEEGISQTELADCMACHPDGREHDD